MSRALLTLLVIALIGPVASAQVIGSDPTSGDLHSVNPATGATTLIGNTGFFNVVDIALTPAGLIGSTGGGQATIILINPMTGAATPIGVHAFGAVNSLEADNAGTVYGTFIPGPGGPSDLVTVNTATGALTTVGPTGIIGSIGGLTFSGGVLFGITSGGSAPTLLTISTATGMATPIGPIVTPGGVSISSLGDGPGGLIGGGYDGVLYSINPMTGVATAIGPHGAALKLSGIETLAPPTPPTYPGTGEDLVSTVAVNGSPLAPVVSGNDVLAIAAGDFVEVRHESPSGTFVGIGDFISVGSVVVTPNPLPSPFPGIYLDPTTTFLIIGGTVGGFPYVLPAPGTGFSFVNSGTLAGASFGIQAFVITGAASNMIFASTNALELQLF